MPRRKSLIAQMYEAPQKAKLQCQKEEERLRAPPQEVRRNRARLRPDSRRKLLNSAGRKNAQLGSGSERSSAPVIAITYGRLGAGR
jgi:hypothetical protein